MEGNGLELIGDHSPCGKIEDCGVDITTEAVMDEEKRKKSADDPILNCA